MYGSLRIFGDQTKRVGKALFASTSWESGSLFCKCIFLLNFLTKGFMGRKIRQRRYVTQAGERGRRRTTTAEGPTEREEKK